MDISNQALFKQQCYINGAWQNATSAQTLTVINPANGQLVGTIPNMGSIETRLAIQAAHAALPAWRSKTAKERSQLLRRWYDLILSNLNDLAIILTTEQGKPLAEAQGEIRYGASFIEWFAEEAKRVYGDIIPAPIQNQHIAVIKQPIGVVGAITPWNFPNAMITRKCAPALAAGCTVVIKPAESTPYSAFALAELAEQAGIPAGVINIITGNAVEIGDELTQNPLVKKITFTGSTRVGKLLMQKSASTVKKLSLELGGNAPFIIFADADIDAAVAGVMASKFRNAGQTCVCANRILVEDSIYDNFSKKLIAAVKALTVGNGFEPTVQQGPLINTAAVAKVEAHITDAIVKGAILGCGGKRHALGGNFFEPTVLCNVTPNMLIAREETFGPVAPLFRFSTEAQAIQMANDTEFGLASYFYSRDINRVWRVAEQLEYGIVSINTGIFSNEVAPFGGVKESGIGREGSKYGMEDFLEIKYLCMGS